MYVLRPRASASTFWGLLIFGALFGLAYVYYKTCQVAVQVAVAIISATSSGASVKQGQLKHNESAKLSAASGGCCAIVFTILCGLIGGSGEAFVAGVVLSLPLACIVSSQVWS